MSSTYDYFRLCKTLLDKKSYCYDALKQPDCRTMNKKCIFCIFYIMKIDKKYFNNGYDNGKIIDWIYFLAPRFKNLYSASGRCHPPPPPLLVSPIDSGSNYSKPVHFATNNDIFFPKKSLIKVRRVFGGSAIARCLFWSLSKYATSVNAASF